MNDFFPEADKPHFRAGTTTWVSTSPLTSLQCAHSHIGMELLQRPESASLKSNSSNESTMSFNEDGRCCGSTAPALTWNGLASIESYGTTKFGWVLFWWEFSNPRFFELSIETSIDEL